MITELTQYDIIQRLWRTGWLERPEKPRDLEQTIAEYQSWHHLKTDGWCGPLTSRHLSLPRFCSYPDNMRFETRGARWEKEVVTYFIRDAVPGLTLEETRLVYDQAMAAWDRVCGINLRRAPSYGEADIKAHNHSFGDGRGGVLADSQLPPTTPIRQRYDSDERWTDSKTPAHLIDFLAVATHEVGHAIGLGHSDDQSALLAPFYEPGRREPQADDIAGARELYGPPQPPPPPPTETSPFVRVEITHDGRKWFAEGDMREVAQMQAHGIIR